MVKRTQKSVQLLGNKHRLRDDCTEKDKHQILLKCGIKDMTQIDIYMKQKPSHRHREQTSGFQDRGLGEECSKR